MDGAEPIQSHPFDGNTAFLLGNEGQVCPFRHSYPRRLVQVYKWSSLHCLSIRVHIFLMCVAVIGTSLKFFHLEAASETQKFWHFSICKRYCGGHWLRGLSFGASA